MKCLIADDMHTSIIGILEEGGWEVDYLPGIDRSEILRAIRDYHCLIIRSKTQVDGELIREGRNLKILARAGAGTDNFDHRLIEELGITLLNAPEGNRDAVGDHTLGLLLSLTKHISRAHRQVMGKKWLREENRGEELNEMTVGIIGFGNTGTAVARRLQGFGCRILVHDRYKKGFSSEVISECSMEEIQQQSDAVTFHIPLTDVSRHMINEEFLSGFSKPAYLINCSRGEIADTRALLQALEEGWLKGLALDVLENEKLETLTSVEERRFDKLLKNENVILTPHIGGWSHESYRRISEVLGRKILDVIDL